MVDVIVNKSNEWAMVDVDSDEEWVSVSHYSQPL